MPRWVYHPSLRKARDKRVARRIFSVLDLPGPGHFKWRKYSHDISRAVMIGYILGGREGVRLALNHITEDMVFDRLRELGVPEEIAQKIVYRLFK